RISILDSKTAREIAQFTSQGTSIVDLQFSPDGKLLSSSSTDGVSRIWNLATGSQLAVLKTNGILRKAIFSPDSKLILTALENAAHLSNVDGTEYRSFSGPQNRISAAAFSPDGRLAATGSFDGTAKIWSVQDGALLTSLEGHTKPVIDLAFGHDGKLLITTSRDGTARIWKVGDATE